MSSRISVIIPVYNVENMIERCVESIIYGEMRDISVILVDDCSKDGSWGSCQKLAKRYPNVCCYQNEENRGVSYTRNHGLEIAESEYILFVDSDDWVSGQYAKKLVETAELNQNSLVICGLHFRDEVAGYRRDYLWEEGGNEIYRIRQEDFFDLPEKFHLQQLWNKIFRRDVIEKAHIRFDETQSMGEDFQFVLDYMEAAQIQECTVINEPLYYYIRWNNSSLMSHFGVETQEKAQARFGQLCRLCGNTPEAIERCKKEIEQLQNNYVYHTVRSNKLKKREKLEIIKRLKAGKNASTIYHRHKAAMVKEQVIVKLNMIYQVPARVRGKLSRISRQKKVDSLRLQLHNRDVTIISQNCIGGVLYHDMRLPFSSPTINLFIWEPDFVRMVCNLEHYMNAKLELSWGEEYPLGVLGGDVHIDFMHYHSCTEVRDSWERRKKRINWDNIVVLATDRNGFTESVFEQWRTIQYPKVLFTVNQAFQNGLETVLYQMYEKNGFVPDLIPNREFYKDGVVLSVLNGSGIRC